MINVVTFREHTISALPYILGASLWGATYTVCLRGEMICNSNDTPHQSSAQLAENAAVLTAIRYVEDRLALPGSDLGRHPVLLTFPDGC